MNALTYGQMKEILASMDLKDSDPVYVHINTKEDDGSESGFIYALETVGGPFWGGSLALGAYEGGMDSEDEAIC